MSWTLETSQGNEAEKIRNRVAFYLNGKGLDLGCGPWKVTSSKGHDDYCIGVDLMGAEISCSIGKLDLFSSEFFDYVFSSHALEDFEYTPYPLREWWRLVKVGGYLILYLPLTRLVAKDMGLENWQDFYPNMGDDGANTNHRQDLDPRKIKKLMGEIGDVEIIEDEIRSEGNEYSFLLVLRKRSSMCLGITSITSDLSCLCKYHASHSPSLQTEAEQEVQAIPKSKGCPMCKKGRALVIRYG